MPSVFKGRAVGGHAGGVDAAEVRQALSLLADPAAGCEVFALPSCRSLTRPGDDLGGLCRWVEAHGGGRACLVTLNPVRVGLAAAPKVGDVLRRRRFLIDVDARRPEAGATNATEAEHEAARAVACAVLDHLAARDWPAPLLLDSGNGFQIVYGVDLPADQLSRALLRGLMKALGERFDTPGALIDRDTAKATARCRIPGTWNRKGPASPERPHRQVRIVHAPDALLPVPLELLRAEAGAAGEPRPTPPPSPVPSPFRGHAPPTGREAAYARAALGRECGRVALAAPGTREPSLRDGAFRMGRYVGAGLLPEAEASAALLGAAERAGLFEDPNCGRRHCEDTVRRALAAGAEHPRGAPARNGVHRPDAPPPPEGEALTVSLAAVEPMRVDWLVPNRIPKRFITVFAGRTGVGKSFVALDLIARLTRGEEIPFAGGELFAPGGALLLSEDSLEYVLAPRLLAAGADMGRVRAMTWKAMGAYHLSDVQLLERAAGEVEDLRLVMIDPPTNFLGDVNEHKNSEVRQVVMKVVEWVMGRDLALLFILHVNKSTGKGVEAINRVMGSVAWMTTARIGHTFCTDPEDRSRCLFLPLKNNLGPLGKGLAYRVAGEAGGAKVEWLAEVDNLADEAMAGERGKPRRVVASEWLIERFREKREWPSDELFRAAHEAGVSRNAVFEAKAALDLPTARRHVTEDGSKVYCWWVPEDWPPLVSRSGVPTSETPGHQDTRDEESI